jgi:glutamate/tyrosine decarboxylase-like PLP-dependent enzyme
MKDLKENLLCVSYQNESIVLYYDRQNTTGIKKLLTAQHQNNEYISDYMQTENVYAIVVKPEINYSAFCKWVKF